MTKGSRWKLWNAVAKPLALVGSVEMQRKNIEEQKGLGQMGMRQKRHARRIRWDSKLRLGAPCNLGTGVKARQLPNFTAAAQSVESSNLNLVDISISPSPPYCVPGNTGLLSSVIEGLIIKSGYFRHRDYIDFTLVKMKFSNKASSLGSCGDVASHTFQLVVMLFVGVAAAVPAEMLKREV
ncbi:hypothetical protein B0H19DRAFT_1065404 [Mycena capillaripes]|nr:hypothetical protein B0H19DRAFT_1065404 [Mycena capillaripes]